MKRIGFILLLFTSSVGFAQKYAVKTNLAYWATTTLNIGGEIALAPRMTLDMTANYNPFHFRGNKKIMHWAVQPELDLSPVYGAFYRSTCTWRKI